MKSFDWPVKISSFGFEYDFGHQYTVVKISESFFRKTIWNKMFGIFTRVDRFSYPFLLSH